MKEQPDDAIEIRDVRGNSTGMYYTLNRRTHGQGEVPITVKHTRHNTFACLTCLVVDCVHARFVERHVTALSQGAVA